MLGQSRVRLRSYQDIVCDAGIVVTESQVRELPSLVQKEVLKAYSHQDGDWAVVCNDGVPLLDVGLRARCAKVAWDQHETPLCAGLGVVVKPFQGLIDAVGEHTGHDGVVWEACMVKALSAAGNQVEPLLLVEMYGLSR